MAKYATGKKSQAISDRSGMAFPYTEMVKEWNGSFVHYSEFEPKHPQIRRKHNVADAIALQNSRNMKFQQPIQPFINNNTSDVTISNSGGRMVGVANLTLPGDFAFKTQDFKITRVIDGVQVTSVLHSMIPEDPAEQNRRRQADLILGNVTVNSSTGANPTVVLSTTNTLVTSIPSVVTTANQTLVTTVASGELYLGGGATGNVYYFNGGARNMALSAPVNSTFFFNQNDGTNDGHPLIITTSTSSPNSNIVSSGITWYLDGNVTQSNYVNTTNFNAATTRYVEWTPTSAGIYYFACYVHGIGMGGAISIS
tara:strand:+ start:364 stop:1296 length:933 start_codon:yes stop_codon:yes gene_type:complete